jgi:hypothetical protein
MTQRDRGQKKMIYRTVTEEDGSKNTTTFRPADLHDDQNGPDTTSFIAITPLKFRQLLLALGGREE